MGVESEFAHLRHPGTPPSLTLNKEISITTVMRNLSLLARYLINVRDVSILESKNPLQFVHISACDSTVSSMVNIQ